MQKALPDQNRLNEALLYDPVTGALDWRARPRHHFSSDVEMRRWNTRYAGKPALSNQNREGYLTGGFDGVAYQAHRIIWKMMTGNDPDYIDHINGHRNENSWANLREVDWGTNYQNQCTASNNTSGSLGVYLNKRTGKWIARICVNRRQINLGTFANQADAITARKQAETKYGFHPNHGR